MWPESGFHVYTCPVLLPYSEPVQIWSETDVNLLHGAQPGLSMTQIQRDNATTNTNCWQFYALALQRRLTHYFYFGGIDLSHVRANDTTMVTVMTLDRYQFLEEMVKQWSGPMVVVLHGDSHEVMAFTESFIISELPAERPNIAVHVVYRRGVCTQRQKGRHRVTALVITGDVGAASNVSSDDQGSHPDDVSVSL